VGTLATALTYLGDERLPLVAAGGGNSRIFAGAAPGSGTATGYVTDAELRALYEGASCFVLPSLYEGFGLPALEAMSCGCPVIASNTASLPEVCGDGALLCDPRDPKDIAARISFLLDQPGERERLRQRGMARAGEFTWRRSIQTLLDILDRLNP
jgi:glycosyltransferase involved in cell wall biosynthesis